MIIQLADLTGLLSFYTKYGSTLFVEDHGIFWQVSTVVPEGSLTTKVIEGTGDETTLNTYSSFWNIPGTYFPNGSSADTAQTSPVTATSSTQILKGILSILNDSWTDADNSLRNTLYDAETSTKSRVDHLGFLRTAKSVRLCGDNFEGNTLDTNIWTVTNTGTGGSTLSNALCTISTGTTSNSTAKLNSVRLGRFIVGAVNYYVGGVRLPDTGTSNNTRRWGVFNANNGFGFQISNTTVGIFNRKGGSDTVVTSFNFNGRSAFTLDTNFHSYEIYYSASKVLFFQDKLLIHTLSVSSSMLTNSLNLPIGHENINTGGSTTNVNLEVRSGAISRLGEVSSGTVSYHSGSTGTTVLKRSAGELKRVVVNTVGSGSNSITIYDNTAGSGTVLAVLSGSGTAQNTQAFTVEYNLPFDTGLTIVISATAGDITVIYE